MVQRVVLGAQLRRLREAAGITRERAAEAIRAAPSKMSRLELGRVKFKDRDLTDLLTLYGVTDEEERAGLLALANGARTRGWWHRYSEIVPDWFQAYVGLEEAATRIRTYEVQFVPGLLQTAAYAHAVISLDHAEASAEETALRVDLRMRRQAILDAPHPPKLWAVLDEAVLRRPIGDHSVMRGQVEHLITMTARPNVTVYIVPFHTGGHAAAGGPFSILRFAEADIPDVVYLEQLTSALYLDKRDDVDSYTDVMDRLCVQAESRAATADLLTRLLTERY